MRKLRWVPLRASDLRALGACESERRELARLFPRGATPDDVPRAVEAGAAYWQARASALAAWHFTMEPA